jgi:hypothetical protein
MLIWYSNIPEEITYFKERYDHYMILMWTIFAVNFVVPFYTLISRDAKRNTKYLTRVGVIILIGHFADLYLAVIPGTIHGHLLWGFGEGKQAIESTIVSNDDFKKESTVEFMDVRYIDTTNLETAKFELLDRKVEGSCSISELKSDSVLAMNLVADAVLLSSKSELEDYSKKRAEIKAEHKMHEKYSVGFGWWFEIGMLLGFLGLFLRVVLTTLTKAPLIPKNHPFLQESANHHI